MPELPEVETTIRELTSAQPPILGAGFIDVWTDAPKIVQKPENFALFKTEIMGKKIKQIWRRGKNIVFELSNGMAILLHQKLTGHLLYDNWHPVKSLRSHGVKIANGNWQPVKKGPLEEKINTYIHLVFRLDNGKMLALSDLRKFAKVELWDSKELKKELESCLGPEALDEGFNFEKFKMVLKSKKGKIKEVLMDQKTIAGIGNIYSDEILWKARVSPFKAIERLSDEEIKRIYDSMKEILKRAVELKGESISDYRTIYGERGFYEKERKIYRREGEKCSRCGATIQRKKIGGRSAHFCPKCQK